MKILILHRAPLWGSGSGTYVRKIAEELSKNNEVAIVCPETHELSGVKMYYVKTPYPGVFYSHPDYPKAKKYSDMTVPELTEYILPYLKKIITAIEDFKPDIIHVQHASFLVWIADYIKSMYNIPFVVTVHGPDLNAAIVDRRIKVVTKKSLKYASKVLANSFDSKNRFLAIFGQSFRGKMRTIFPGVDLKLFPLPRKIEIINKKYPLKNKRLVIYVGRLDKEKGVEYLIKAAKNISAQVYILGSGDYENDLKDLTKKMHLTNVYFAGYFNKENSAELREFYQLADVVVVPSTIKEGLGLVILEAMACRTPVVASKIGGIPNIVKDGKTGFLVKPRSSDEIAEKVNKILNNEKLRLAMKERSRQLIEQKYTWEKAVGAIYDSYEKSLRHIKKTEAEEVFDKLINWIE